MTLLEQAREFIKQGDKAKAKAILASLVQTEPQNANAWLLLATVLDDPKQIAYCQERTRALQSQAPSKPVIISPPQASQKSLQPVIQQPAPSQPMKKCPYCAEMVLAEAEVCRYCGRNINPKIIQVEKTQAVGTALGQAGCSIMQLLFLIPLLIFLFFCLYVLFTS